MTLNMSLLLTKRMSINVKQPVVHCGPSRLKVLPDSEEHPQTLTEKSNHNPVRSIGTYLNPF